jgi:hypothetical protein
MSINKGIDGISTNTVIMVIITEDVNLMGRATNTQKSDKKSHQ